MVAGKTVPELLRLFWRRKLWIIVPVLLGAGLSYVLLRRTEPIYRASTMILVEPQRVPSDYIKPTITSSLQDRLKTIEQQITNRENLEHIVKETNLFPELIKAGDLEQAVELARRDLLIEVQRNTSVFWIHFKGSVPAQVAEVANRIADAFIKENLRIRRGQAESTTSFLIAELAELQQQLEEQESRVATFRLRHEGSLPEQRPANEAAIERLHAKLDLASDQIDNAELRRLILERGLPPPADKKGKTVVATAPPPTRLSQLQSQVSEMRLRYTDRHPEVLRLEAEIERLRSEAPPPAPPPLAAEEPPASADPVVLAQLEAIRMETQKLRAEREAILEQVAEYQGRLEQSARTELELLAMNRDYDNLQGAYDSLLGKKMEAELAENLEQGRQGEQFTILERALPPTKPYAPDVLLYLGVGLVGGALLGIALVFVREETDHTFRTADDLQRVFPAVPVLATVPRVTVLDDGLQEEGAA